MRRDNPDPEARCQLRKPIILIGAPSGAGKTVLSRKIIAGEFPLFAELCGSASEVAPLRYDLKVLPNNPPRDRVLIIECSTYKFRKLTRSEQWHHMLTLLKESELIIHVNLKVSRRTIVRQYFRRIFTEPKRLAVRHRILQISKYRTTLDYMLTRQIQLSDEAWDRFGEILTRKIPSRVASMWVQKIGPDYHCLLKRALPANCARR